MKHPEAETALAKSPSEEWGVPPFDRLTYHYGQVLSPQQLQRAQKSVYDRAMLHNRCLHGWGVACGLAVHTGRAPQPECPPPGHEPPPPGPRAQPPAGEYVVGEATPLTEQASGQHPPHPHTPPLWVAPGLALDSPGHELVVRAPMAVDVAAALPPEDRKKLSGAPVTLYVSLRYRSYGIEPARPHLPESCGVPPDPTWTFWRDGACVEVSLSPPPQDERCETCCAPAPSEVVLLARVDQYQHGKPVAPEQIHNEVRRPLSLRIPTVVTGVSWRHGASYRAEDVDALLWNHGLRVRFSRPVHAESLQPGTFDVFLVELGKGRSGVVRMLKGEFVTSGPPMVDEFTYRLTDNERVDPGDRILFVLRAGFLLDQCCAPVDGLHVGGRIPAFQPKGYPSPASVPPVTVCSTPPRRFGAWTSGDGAGGSTFESWIYVVEERGRPSQKKEEEAR
ncbi:hypothetical protein [Pyxidicoccus xibeiensis]|uniref:hypothetical protein n=1 Tax=Pyxidicoccus xibeiensis TaxID=2906759 RepID=UPI0020A71166|nr:hypothetical protein [Pyxidicoccus xibeiensis]MCP3143387.1 hypothetical protein [Pyxidicoccus xibeiensis]